MDAPSVIERLRARAETLRVRRSEVADVLARHAGSLGADATAQLAAEATALSERYATAVAALENLRLDLIRLRAGASSMESLTADLAAARGIGEEIERLVAADDAVSALLRTYRAPAA